MMLTLAIAMVVTLYVSGMFITAAGFFDDGAKKFRFVLLISTWPVTGLMIAFVVISGWIVASANWTFHLVFKGA